MPSLNTKNAILSNAITVDSSYNVAIGGTPTAIGGYTSLIINNNSTGSFLDLNNSGINNLRLLSLGLVDQRIQAQGTLRFDTAGIARMAITSDGNVGIGNTAPSDILDVQKNQNAITNFYFRNTDTTNSSSRAYLNLISGSTSFTIASINGGDNYIAGTSGRNLYFQQNIGGTVNMTITSGGSLGLGTSSPFNPGGGGQTSFEMSGTNYSTIYLSANSATVRGQIGADNLNAWVEVGARTNHPLLLVTNNTERMRVTSEGISIKPGLVYSIDLTYNSDWAVNFQSVVPTGTLGGNKVYLFTIWTSSFGTPPYYAAASGIITTASNTNSGGSGPEITLLTSHHVGSTSTWQIRTSTAGNSTNGVQAKLLNGPSTSGAVVYIRVSLLSSF